MLTNGPKLWERFQARHPLQTPVPFTEALAQASLVFDQHSEFLDYYKQRDTDFIYDLAADVYLVGLQCPHVPLLAALYRYYGGVETDQYKAADRYIIEGLGIFKSRKGSRIYRGIEFLVPPILRPIYRDMEILS